MFRCIFARILTFVLKHSIIKKNTVELNERIIVVKKIRIFGVFVFLIALISTLFLVSCEKAYSPFENGMIFTEMDDGYLVEPLPLATSPKSLVTKVLTTVSLDIPEKYMGVPIVGVKGFLIYPALVKVTLPDTITYIERNSFGPLVQCNEYGGGMYLGNEDNPYLALVKPKSNDITSCEIHPETKVIAHDAFEECTSLTSITFKGNIPPFDYHKIANLSTVVFDNVPKNIDSLAFGKCLPNLDGTKSVTTIVFKNGIPEHCDFSNISDSFDLVIGEGVTKIPDSAFYNCESLKSVRLSNAVTHIEAWAFKGCTSFNDVYFEGDIADWIEVQSKSTTYHLMDTPDNLYLNGELLTELTIPEYLTSIADGVFSGIDSLKCVVIPNHVTSIGAGAFSNCTGLKSVVFSDFMKSTGEHAFSGCIALEDIVFGASIARIDSMAFRGCCALENITIPNTVTAIDSRAFEDCTSLRDVTIPNTVTDMGFGIFINCTSLEHIVIPDSVATLGSSTFYGCTSLRDVTLSGSLTEIGSNSFKDCTALESIIIPDSVTNIKSGAFEGCSALESVTIPDPVKNIESNAFSDCIALKSATIFGTDLKISEFNTNNESAFENCPSLSTITFVDEIPDFGYWRIPALTTVIIEDGITKIPYSAFYGCGTLKNVTIPNTVTDIATYAFYRCTSLESIELPSSLEKIGICAFDRCSALKNITIPGSVTEIDSRAFDDCTSLESVIFENTSGWQCKRSYNSAKVVDISDEDLADHTKAAELLGSTYVDECWSRTE